jgi:cytochrome P450
MRRISPSTPVCDLFWAGSKPNAHALYAAAQARSPVCFDVTQNAWIVLGYEAAVACLKDTERLSNDPVAEFDPFVVGGDPPEHTKYRRTLQESVRFFDKAAVVAFTEQWLGVFFSRIRPAKVFDAVADLAVPLVDDLAGHLVGLTPEEMDFFRSLRPENRSHVRGFDEAAWEFFSNILRSESSGRRGSAIGHFLECHAKGLVNEHEAVSMLRLLWIGGTATSNLFNPSALMLLVRHHEVKQTLLRDPSRIPAFISEALRLEGPITTVPRRAKIALELCGQEIQADDALQICLLAANSDPAVFPSPDKIDLSRPTSRPIAFGFGIHHCLGGFIARALAETVVGCLLRELPHLRLAEPLESLAYEEGNLRGLKRLLLYSS